MGLKPAFRLLANDNDVTEHISKNLVSLSFHDEDGIKADRLEIKVHGDFRRPKYKDELKLYLYYKEKNEEFYCGLFLVQNCTRNKKNMITISATATDFSSSLKQLKNRSFSEVNIKQIVEQIAAEHDLNFKCDFEDIYFPYIAQTNESDISFLNRIAKDYFAVYSIKNGTIVFLRQDEDSSLKTVTIDANECGDETPVIKNSNKTYYESVAVKYQDTKKNSIEDIQIGSSEPIYKIEETFTNKDNLETKAKSKLKRLNKGTKSGHFKIYGFGIYARSNLKFLNINKEDDITYHIDTIHHTLDENGWNMRVEFSNN